MDHVERSRRVGGVAQRDLLADEQGVDLVDAPVQADGAVLVDAPPRRGTGRRGPAWRRDSGPRPRRAPTVRAACAPPGRGAGSGIRPRSRPTGCGSGSPGSPVRRLRCAPARRSVLKNRSILPFPAGCLGLAWISATLRTDQGEMMGAVGAPVIDIQARRKPTADQGVPEHGQEGRSVLGKREGGEGDNARRR